MQPTSCPALVWVLKCRGGSWAVTVVIHVEEFADEISPVTAQRALSENVGAYNLSPVSLRSSEPQTKERKWKTCMKLNCEIETSLYFRPFSLLDWGGGGKLFPLQRGLDKVYTSLRPYLNPPNKAYMRLLWSLAPCAGPLHEDGFIPSALQIIHSVYFL